MHGETSVPSGHLSNSGILDICRGEECREEHEGCDGDSPKFGEGRKRIPLTPARRPAMAAGCDGDSPKFGSGHQGSRMGSIYMAHVWLVQVLVKVASLDCLYLTYLLQRQQQCNCQIMRMRSLLAYVLYCDDLLTMLG